MVFARLCDCHRCLILDLFISPEKPCTSCVSPPSLVLQLLEATSLRLTSPPLGVLCGRALCCVVFGFRVARPAWCCPGWPAAWVSAAFLLRAERFCAGWVCSLFPRGWALGGVPVGARAAVHMKVSSVLRRAPGGAVSCGDCSVF